MNFASETTKFKENDFNHLSEKNASLEQKSIETWAKIKKEKHQIEYDKLRADCLKKKDYILREIPGIGGMTSLVCEPYKGQL